MLNNWFVIISSIRNDTFIDELFKKQLKTQHYYILQTWNWEPCQQQYSYTLLDPHMKCLNAIKCWQTWTDFPKWNVQLYGVGLQCLLLLKDMIEKRLFYTVFLYCATVWWRICWIHIENEIQLACDWLVFSFLYLVWFSGPLFNTKITRDLTYA